MADAILYDYWRSSAAYRVRIALNLKGIDYEQRIIDLSTGAQRSDEFRAISPQGFVPLLEIDGRRLSQSLSILVYLDQTRPEPLLMPRDAADGAHVRAMALAIACDVHPLNNLRVLKYLSHPLKVSEERKSAWYDHWIREGFAALETMAQPMAGQFLFGDTPTIADICLVPQMYNARHRSSVDLAEFPTLVRADSNAQIVEAFATAHPSKQDVPV